MIYTLKNYLPSGVFVLIVILLLGSCFVADSNLFNGIVIAKNLWVELVGMIAVFMMALKLLKRVILPLSYMDILVILLSVWMLLREVLSAMPQRNPVEYSFNILIYVSIYFFIRLYTEKNKNIQMVIFVYLIIVWIQSCIGLLQLYGIISSNHAIFKLTGTFHNPGPFSGYIVSGFPMALALYYTSMHNATQKKSRLMIFVKRGKVNNKGVKMRLDIDKLIHYFSQLSIVLLLFVIVVTRSRSAWLALVISSVYVAFSYGIPQKLRDKCKCYFDIKNLKCFSKTIYISLFIFLVISLLFMMYKFKQGSADGRVLIWKVSWEMMKDKPLVGWGQGGFDANYANYQAAYFLSGKGTPKQELLAGLPNAPFNEFIRVIINYGIVGFLMLIFLLIIVFKIKLHKNTVQNEFYIPVVCKVAIISMVVFAFSSYPIDVSSVKIQFVILLGILSKYDLRISDPFKRKGIPVNIKWMAGRYSIFKKVLQGVICIVCVFSMSFLAQNLVSQHKGFTYWQNAYQLYNYQLYKDACDEYEKANFNLENNGTLLQMYGKCLCLDEQYKNALNILNQADCYLSSSIIETTKGDCYKGLGLYKKAESHYLSASYMEPVKMYPIFLLAKLYESAGEYASMKMLAEMGISKSIKVNSPAVLEMKHQLKKLLQK